MSIFGLNTSTYLFIFLIICLVGPSGCRSTVPQTSPDTTAYPTGVVIKPQFKKESDDSLVLIQEFEHYNGSKMLVGKIRAIASDDTNIYLADFQQGKIIVLDKRTNSFKRTIGNGPGNGPGDLNKPFNVYIFNGNLVVPHYTGQFMFTIFSPEGAVISTINRLNYDPNYAADPTSNFLRDSIVYFSNNIARDLKKVEVLKLSSPLTIPFKSILPVTDFQSMSDSATLSTVLPKFFLLNSAKGDKFFAAPGNKPLLNTYKYNGQLIGSYDLRNIPALYTFYEDLASFFESGSPTYFSSIVTDNDDYVYFYSGEITNLKAIKNKQVAPEKVQFKTCFVAVNLQKLTYKIFRSQNKSLVPLKIIDDQIWSYDREKSTIVIQQMPHNNHLSSKSDTY